MSASTGVTRIQMENVLFYSMIKTNTISKVCILFAQEYVKILCVVKKLSFERKR